MAGEDVKRGGAHPSQPNIPPAHPAPEQRNRHLMATIERAIHYPRGRHRRMHRRGPGWFALEPAALQGPAEAAPSALRQGPREGVSVSVCQITVMCSHILVQSCNSSRAFTSLVITGAY
jgi:hypothetical protein